MTIFEVVEGTTAPLDFPLTENGVAADLAGKTLTLVLKDKAGNAVTIQGTLSSPVAGTLRYTPHASDLVAASTPHTARFKVSSGGSIKFFPGGGGHDHAGDPMRWRVVAQ